MTQSRKPLFPFISKSVKVDRICNICQQEKELSVDHVPPKGCPPAKSRVTSKLLYQMVGHTAFRPRQDQNGVTFKTICADCNSLLGSRYDRPLGELSRRTENFVTTNVKLPDKFDIECQPNAVIRAVLGHLLAAKTETDDSVIDRLIRPCVLDQNTCVPDDIHVFYWIYPYEEIKILRDFVISAMRDFSKNVGAFSLLKYYPIAFLVAHDLPSYGNLNSLHSFNQISPAEKKLIPISFRPIPRADFPENSPSGIMFGKSGLDSIHSVPKSKKKR